MSCFTNSQLDVDGITLLYLIMILINVVILSFMALTTESFETYQNSQLVNGFSG